jgi:hypothetical protein
MSFEDLVIVIKVAGKVDNYLSEIHSGLSENGLAREYAININLP